MNRTDSVQQVHQLYRASFAVVASLGTIGTLCEVTAGAIALASIAQQVQFLSAWAPGLVFGLTAAASVFRGYSGNVSGFAQQCRKLSLRSYSSGDPITPRASMLLDDDAPWLVLLVRPLFESASLIHYYDPQNVPGDARQCELYAHSAFFTWRITQIQSVVLFGVAAVSLAVGAVVVYGTAVSTHDNTKMLDIMDAVFSVLLTVICVRSAEAAWRSYGTYRVTRQIEQNLFQQPVGKELEDLSDAYDLERAAGAQPMTAIHYLINPSLTSKWKLRQSEFSESSKE